MVGALLLVSSLSHYLVGIKQVVEPAFVCSCYITGAFNIFFIGFRM